MIIKPDSIVSDVAAECDVCIIGSGSAGSVAAMEMAEAGFSVVVFEEGGHFSGADLNQDERDMLRALYRQRYTKDLSIALTQANCLGGGPLINMADCVRTPDEVLHLWEKKFGITDISPDVMGPYFERAEEILQAKKITEHELNRNNLIVKKGCDALGYRGDTFINNRRECIECGFCLLGCTYDRKQATTLNYIPRALAHDARIYTSARADRIETEGGKVRTVTGVISDPRTKREKVNITVQARVVMLAANTINTPQILLYSGIGNESGLLGKNLLLQPHTMVSAFFDEELKSYRGIPQAYFCDHFESIDGDRGLGGFRLEGGFTMPGQVATIIPGFGHTLKERMTKYNHMANMMVLVYDEPQGEVTLNRRGRPVVSYELSPETKKTMMTAMKEAVNVMFGAGAKEVMFTYEIPAVITDPRDITIIDDRGVEPNSMTLMSFHMQGTCRMGPDPASSVVDNYLECHDVKNLFVIDASVPPTTASSHNMLPIMAMAHRTCDYIITHRERYFGGRAG
jgi:choline dehydrogenase-like flavoprotein